MNPPGNPPAARIVTFWMKSVAALGALLLLASCAHTVNVTVDSLAKPNAADAVSYRIVNHAPGEPDSLRNQEAEKAVKRALAGKGMYEAPDPARADLVVNLDYGISEPRVVDVERTEPVYQFIPGYTRTEIVAVGKDAAGRIVYQAQEVYIPAHQEMVGERRFFVKEVVYDKYLRLSARENKPATDTGQAQEIWAVDATSEGEGTNLRKYIPILAAATIENIGKDSKGLKTVRIKDKDENGPVAFVKEGMTPADTK